ncbi:pentatricopeptide repeat-containing protein At3g53360, mitochondrial-like [Telopea speciosissima]|uniref:pentatricopeptide repeat-containing protein At3g53360, mitochondrial-like n=1 Tax=Telopea speciosissima TaxID=54955 RepID=UPI001CC354A4|nr:pentatricopeptide repeat-containing protein At3g53360, mitochondrial-like [Telopea speciosissima]
MCSSAQMIVQSLGFLLHQCSKARTFRHGQSLHAAVIKAGCQADLILSNHVLNMYAKCDGINAARQAFDEMSERNLVSWSAMISGYDQAGEPAMALNLFSVMPIEPNEYIYASVISACASLLALTPGKQVHAQTVKSGYMPISFVSNSLISMYMNCGLYNDAPSIFTSIYEPNSVSYNAMITGFAENMQPERAFEVFKLMHQQGVVPDRFTFMGVFGICTGREHLWSGMEFHCQSIKYGLETTAIVGNVILTMYSKCNLIEETENAFKAIEKKDVISWNTLIAACSHCEDHAKSLRIFREMGNAVGVKPDDFTFTSALAASAGLASGRHGGQIHAYLIRTRPYQDVGVGNALMNLYAKCGCIGYAKSVFNHMVHHNLVSWNTIIAAFGNHGLGREAIELFEQMKAKGPQPDSLTFIGLLIACNHVGLVDEGQAYFKSMKEVYGISPEIKHVSCLIDLLGRAGKLVEAEELMKRSSFENNVVILGSLLSACRLYGDVVVGERVASQLMKFQPVTSSPYVLLSSLYASDGRWDGVAEARKMLKGSMVKKEPGQSLIEVKGMIEKFTAGDVSHSRMEEIEDILRSFSWTVSEVSL